MNGKLALDVWVLRQNARTKAVFGVELPASKAFSKNGGESWRRFNSLGMARAAARDNLLCLKLMKLPKLP